VPESICAAEDGQAERQRDAEQPDAHVRERCREHRASASAEDQNERSYELRHQLLHVPLLRVTESTSLGMKQRKVVLRIMASPLSDAPASRWSTT
jgi:hypothetical protein